MGSVRAGVWPSHGRLTDGRGDGLAGTVGKHRTPSTSWGQLLGSEEWFWRSRVVVRVTASDRAARTCVYTRVFFTSERVTLAVVFLNVLMFKTESMDTVLRQHFVAVACDALDRH